MKMFAPYFYLISSSEHWKGCVHDDIKENAIAQQYEGREKPFAIAIIFEHRGCFLLRQHQEGRYSKKEERNEDMAPSL